VVAGRFSAGRLRRHLTTDLKTRLVGVLSMYCAFLFNHVLVYRAETIFLTQLQVPKLSTGKVSTFVVLF
jgi:hypothetical protein